jgi:DNA-binding XRE family transcriptional regulator
MTKSLDDVMSTLPKKRRAKIERRGEELVDEYLTLAELRKAQKLTQKELAKKLNVNQENISRLEKRSDMMLSTLRNHVEAMGGKLNLTVQFPDHDPVSLTSIGQSKSREGKI